MKISYVILAHKAPEQVVRLVDALDAPGNRFLIHLDRASPEPVFRVPERALGGRPNVKFLNRRRARYAGFGLVEAALDGIAAALESGDKPDMILLISGQDYPIATNERIAARLASDRRVSYIWHRPLPFAEDHPIKGRVSGKMERFEMWHVRFGRVHLEFPFKNRRGPNLFSDAWRLPLWLLSRLFLRKKREFYGGLKPYGGSQWWCLHPEHAAYVLERYRADRKRIRRFFRFTVFSDETFFQTILLNSEYRNEIVNEDFRFANFEGSSHPRVLTTADLPDMMRSGMLFARKFDTEVDDAVLDQIDRTLAARSMARSA